MLCVNVVPSELSVSMNDYFTDGIKQASELIQSFTYPLLREGRGYNPDIFASCVFLKWSEEFFLVTASHVLRENYLGLFTRGKNTLIDVVGKANITRAEKKDHIDIAIITIHKEFILENEINVITEEIYAFTVEVTKQPKEIPQLSWGISFGCLGIRALIRTHTFNRAICVIWCIILLALNNT